ncbi:serine/threonine protein kinase [Luteibacter yeojuensis]|uniref:Stress response kinase A n=1 Tax=Luteibacter yeojuensis TaxID=345309 RepID=A0A0F3L4V3_9GAMM|nr:serine/threonine protein kinase [Luteibacter yeojuensis]KJV37389.1 serine/threonine protein kinase [Luteibacter yeojuensis]
MSQAAPYAALSPDVVLGAVDAAGTWSDGRLLTLNSYENRVFQVGLENGDFVVAKFYRPGRWNDAAIGEEHAFALELAAAEIPVVAPLVFHGRTLLRHEGFRYALYPRRGGRAPSLESADQLEWLGRLLARLHGVGTREPFHHRGTINRATLIDGPARAALGSDLLPPHLFDAYRDAVMRVDDAVANRFEAVGPVQRVRLHGDCHPGNVLWTDNGPHFVDLDDARMGPAVQDLWMLAADETLFDALLEGYGQFRDFDPTELALVPALRAMRQVHYAGWIADRWHDPAFPAAFPFAAEARWWEQHITDLHEAAEAL